MSYKNPIHQKIYEQVVEPSIKRIAKPTEGVITAVNYENQTARVHWRDQEGYSGRITGDIPLPRSTNGFHPQSVKIGDHVGIDFRNGNIESPYISIVHDQERGPKNLESRFGAGIPKGFGSL